MGSRNILKRDHSAVSNLWTWQTKRRHKWLWCQVKCYQIFIYSQTAGLRPAKKIYTISINCNIFGVFLVAGSCIPILPHSCCMFTDCVWSQTINLGDIVLSLFIFGVKYYLPYMVILRVHSMNLLCQGKKDIAKYRDILRYFKINIYEVNVHSLSTLNGLFVLYHRKS